MKRAVATYNAAVNGSRSNDPTEIKWSSSLESRLERAQVIEFDPTVVPATYRPI